MKEATDPRVPGLSYPRTSCDKPVVVATDPRVLAEFSGDILGHPGISLWTA